MRSKTIAVSAMLFTGLIAGCTSTIAAPTPTASTAAPSNALEVIKSKDSAAAALKANQLVWQSSVNAVLARSSDKASITAAEEAAKRLKLPLYLLEGTDTTALAADLKRIGAESALTFGSFEGVTLEGVKLVTSEDDLKEQNAAAAIAGLAVLDTDEPSAGPAVATLAAAGATEISLKNPDPRVESADVKAVADAKPTHVIAVGSTFAPAESLETQVDAAKTGVELPGGGQTIFDHKRYVATYGSPETGALGVFGEQGLEETVTRTQEIAKPYEQFTKDTVVPAFEIISTVAAAEAGKDGDYSRPTPQNLIEPYIKAAQDAGIYVVLDLQPGRTDFLTQSKALQPLLEKYPNVGLALDPEWRLKPDERHLEQIGSVEAAEINQVITWLADLTKKNNLPQKMLLLHQFRLSMIKNRETLDTSRTELAMVIQMDGNGTLGQKQDTWAALQQDAPKEILFGWKNFYDEDTPTPTPGYTFTEVKPTPVWVSYQ